MKKLITICFVVALAFVGCDSRSGEQRRRPEPKPETEKVEAEKVVEPEPNEVEVSRVAEVNEPRRPIEGRAERGSGRQGRGSFGPGDEGFAPGGFGELGQRDRGGFSGRRGFDIASLLDRLDPNDREQLEKDFPDVDFNDPNSLRENRDAMRAAMELLRPGGFGTRTFGDRRGPGQGDPNRPRRPRDSNEPSEPNEPVMINLNNVEMKDVIKKVGEYTGKVIIPDQELMNQRITIYSSKEVPKEEALKLVYLALDKKGFTHKEENGAISLEPIKDIKLESVPIVGPNEPVASLKDRTLVVQKFFKLKTYNATNMGQIVTPLIGEHGHVSSDETTNTLIVIDTVGNLIRIEKIIQQFDAPEFAPETQIKIFKLENADPAELVLFLNQLLSEEGTVGTSPVSRNRFIQDRFRGRSSSSSSTSRSVSRSGSESRPTGTGAQAGATSVTISAEKGPIVLIPEIKRKWIIARASQENLELIGQWIETFDVKQLVESQYEVVQLKHADADDIADGFEDILQKMEVTMGITNVFVEPLRSTNSIMIVGSEENRNIVKKFLEENVDIPRPALPSKTFKLKYRDVDEMKTHLEETFQVEETTSRFSPFGGSRSFRGDTRTQEQIFVSVFPSLNEITVRASQSTLDQIERLIKEMDKPFDWMKPREIELKNTDPVKMVDMLNQLFGADTGTRTTGGRSIFDLIYGRGGDTTEKIMGPLYGKVTFLEVPDAKKIMVICKIPEKYDEIVEFVKELDKAEKAEMPRIIQLKYANPWDVAELLNAFFNEPGTAASVRRPEEGIEYAIQEEETTTGQQQQTTSAEYRPWWSQSGSRTTVGQEMPISNVIGKVRFMPDSRSKSILVLAPSELMEDIENLIADLDKPGKQVMVKLVAVEVDKSKLDSVGLQVASDPTSFSLSENSLAAFNKITHQQSHGSMIFGAGGTSGNTSFIDLGMDINFLLDFLVKSIDAKIVNKQTLWTKDYKNAEFFKGENVALLSDSTVSGTAGAVTQSFDWRDVGMTLRVRPNITPEKNVDMEIDLSLSHLSQDTVNQQPKELKTRANNTMIVKHEQTVLLASILTQEDSRINKKIPVLGDAPLVGGLFQHNNNLKSNNELLVFVTPIVVDEEENPKEVAEVRDAIEKKQEVESDLDEMTELLEVLK